MEILKEKEKEKKKKEGLGGRAEIQQYEFLLFDFVNCLFLASTPIKNKNLRNIFLHLSCWITKCLCKCVHTNEQ